MREVIKHLRKIAKWWWALIAAAWSAFWVADSIIGKWGSPKVKGWWDAHTQHFPSNWETWLIGLLIIALALIIWGSYQHSKANANAAMAEVKRLKELAASLQEELRIERDRAHPNFEIEWAMPIISNASITLNGKETPYTTFFLQVSIYNKGGPSIVRGWEMKCKLTDGAEFTGVSYVPDQEVLTFNSPQGPIKFKTSSDLFRRVTDNPIPTNGRVPGFVFFRFPAGLSQKMATPGVIFSLKIKDINMREYKAEISWPDAPFTEAKRMPGID